MVSRNRVRWDFAEYVLTGKLETFSRQNLNVGNYNVIIPIVECCRHIVLSLRGEDECENGVLCRGW